VRLARCSKEGSTELHANEKQDSKNETRKWRWIGERGWTVYVRLNSELQSKSVVPTMTCLTFNILTFEIFTSLSTLTDLRISHDHL
jgi:hypothetical protein